MSSNNKSRLLYLMKYLWTMSDEEHPVTIVDIMTYLDSLDIKTNQKQCRMTLFSFRKAALTLYATRVDRIIILSEQGISNWRS